MKSEHILHVISSLGQGGAEQLLVDLLTQFHSSYPQMRHTVIVFHDGTFRKNLEKLGITVIHIRGFLTTYDPIFIWRLVKAIRHLQPDGIHSSLWASNFLMRCTARVLKIPLVCSVHMIAPYEGSARTLLQKITPLPSHGFIAVSPTVARSLIDDVGIQPARITVITNGIPEISMDKLVWFDTNRYAIHSPRAVKKSARPECSEHGEECIEGCERKNFIIGTVGRLIAIKHFDLIIQSFALLHAQHPATQLVIIGYGPEEEHLRNLAQQLNLQESVSFLGGVQAREHYHTFDCFVQAAPNEGFSLALLEALSAQLPVIVTSHTSKHDLITHEHDGLIVPHGDQGELAKALEKICNDTLFGRTVAENGYQTFKNRGSIATTCSNYNAIFATFCEF